MQQCVFCECSQISKVVTPETFDNNIQTPKCMRETNNKHLKMQDDISLI